MDMTIIQPLAGAIFMGLGAGFLTYAYGDRLTRKTAKKRKPEKPYEYYDPRKPEKRDHGRIIRAISVGFFMGLMFLLYFANR
jgi:hypothetical protein